jgi:hypothetical protein
MADRKSVLKAPPPRPELEKLLEQARLTPVTDAQLHEQRVSFVYGNAPIDSGITRDSARRAAERMRLDE